MTGAASGIRQLSPAETVGWTIGQLRFTGLFKQDVLDRWGGLPLRERAAMASAAFLSLPIPMRGEIGERFAALGANRAEEA